MFMASPSETTWNQPGRFAGFVDTPWKTLGPQQQRLVSMSRYVSHHPTLYWDISSPKDEGDLVM